jgi:hypothetical protein
MPLLRDKSSHTVPHNWTSIDVNIISTTKFVRHDVKWDLYVTLTTKSRQPSTDTTYSPQNYASKPQATISGDENLPCCYIGRGKKALVTKVASRNAGKECNCIQQELFTPFSGGRAVYGVGMRPLTCWDCGFESPRGHGCLSLLSFECYRVEDSATGRSLIQESYQVCVFLSVITRNNNPLHRGFLTFLRHRALWESVETYGPFLRKMYLNPQNKVHKYRICIYIYIAHIH